MIITTRARTHIGLDPFQRGLDELQHKHQPWFTHYAPDPAVEQAIGEPVRRCIFCCETPCSCDDQNAVERGEVDVYSDDPQEATSSHKQCLLCGAHDEQNLIQRGDAWIHPGDCSEYET